MGTWFVVDALRDFRPWGSGVVLDRVQPLTDGETVTAFAFRIDSLGPPEGAGDGLPTLKRIRPGAADPSEWWWPTVASWGWGRSVGTPLPEKPLKFGVYQLVIEKTPQWRVTPELSVPGP